MKRLPLFGALALAVLGFSSCNKSANNNTANSNKIRIGYIGITCEAPIFTAVENGFFKDEGLEVEMVKCEWSNYKDVLALGGYDLTHHLIMYFLKPIEQGLDVKIAAGVHKGCLRVQVPVNSPIQKITDLKGKRIGAPGMGTPPFIFASRVMGANGMDASKDVTWKVFPAGELGLALEKGEIDAIADSEPIGTLLVETGKVRNLADQAVDEPYKDEYCCAVIVNGKYLAANPRTTAAATRAILKGARWVEENPRAAAHLSVEKKYLASNPELNTVAISHLRYMPSVSGGEAAVNSAATEMKKANMLAPSTDVPELARKAFVQLEGVSDEWIQNLKIDKVAGGQIDQYQGMRLAAELAAEKAIEVATCCSPKGKVAIK
jgi:NitT/TauT family transport system substrate-binding protein